jgi:transcriptional regulator with XRE-family HTH domain
MEIGTKIGILRRKNKLSQPDLAFKLDISQTALSEIESGKTKKIDFLLMHKVCEIFDVDFDYFLNKESINFQFEKIEKTKGGNIGCKIETINNNFPEGILENMLKRIEKLEQLAINTNP